MSRSKVGTHLCASRERALYFFLCISPWLLGFLVFKAGPLVVSLVLSFTEWDFASPPRWVGLDNYRRILTSDPLFYQSLKVTFLYTLFGVFLKMVLALAIAVALNQKLKLGRTAFRTIFYMPSVVSGVAAALLWMCMFNPDAGIINYLLRSLGIPGPNWLFDTKWVLPAFVIMSLWQTGVPAVIFLAGLQNIPEYLYEAAEIDGANGWQRFLHITVPMLAPIIFFNTLMGIIQSFQVFTEAYVMTSGGPMNASLFYVLYLFRVAFQYFEMGYASALAWVLFIILLILTVLAFRVSDRWVYYEGRVRG